MRGREGCTWNAKRKVSSVFAGLETSDRPMTYSLKSIVPERSCQHKNMNTVHHPSLLSSGPSRELYYRLLSNFWHVKVDFAIQSNRPQLFTCHISVTQILSLSPQNVVRSLLGPQMSSMFCHNKGVRSQSALPQQIYVYHAKMTV